MLGPLSSCSDFLLCNECKIMSTASKTDLKGYAEGGSLAVLDPKTHFILKVINTVHGQSDGVREAQGSGI